MEERRVAIVGAGASGLPSIRFALAYGFEPVCFELSDEVGGLWHYKPEITPEGSVMRTTVINTSKEMTAFSDFPPPEKWANFMHNEQMLEYFQLYAKNFDLYKYIKFHHRVSNVKRAEDYDISGKWIVYYEDGNHKVHEETFDAVLLCTGHHTTPYWPEKWPNQDKFKGKISHAHDFKDYRGHENKNVTIVGVGNSGFDIAIDLARIAKKVYVSTRRGTWVYNRVWDFGQPYDLIIFSKFVAFLRRNLPYWLVNNAIEFKLSMRFDHALYGLKPKHRALSAHPTVNDELPNRMLCGTVIVKPNIKEFTETGIVFEDESKVENVDELILSTGYSFSFPLAEGGKLIPVNDNHVRLYKLMYPLETSNYNNLAVIGLIQPLGSIMPISELQARLFFHNLAGKCKLPSPEAMLDDINERDEKMKKRYVNSRRHTIQVDYENYMDELAELMDCKPNLCSLLLTDPYLSFKLFFGPNLPYAYRLKGTHAWAEARKTILSYQDRVVKGIQNREVPITCNHFPFYIILAVFVIFGLIVRFI